MAISEGNVCLVPAGHRVVSVNFLLAREWQVKATLWSTKLGPKNTDYSQTGFPLGTTTAAHFVDPALFTTGHHDYHVGVDALYSTNGQYVNGFEVVQQELVPNGADAYGVYVLRYIPHANDPGLVDFVVTITLAK
jgi:hypothetical protein